MDTPIFKHVRGAPWYFGAILTAAIAGVAWSGIHRSLWFDEAWLANSARSEHWTAMFRDGDWFQTSPPLFLAIGHFAVWLLGLSTESFRVVPLLFAVTSGLFFFAAARRVSPALAPAATAALLYYRISVEYFISFKQYAAEIAAVTVVLWAAVRYIEDPARKRFAILFLCLVGLQPLAYPLAFVVPAVVLAVFFTPAGNSSASSPIRRAAVLTTGSGAMLVILYLFFIRPNATPALWNFWSQSFAATYSPGMWLAAIALVAATLWGAWRRDPILLLCLIPCVLLLTAEQLHWYPISARTRLFARPCAVLGAARVAEQLFSRFLWWRWAAIAGALAALVGAVTTVRAGAGPPNEDYATAVAYLRDHVDPDDLLVIHPDARDGLLLYFDIEGWHPEDHGITPRWGSTGWPCCARSHPTSPGQSTKAAVRADLERLIPANYRGHVWLVYTTRLLHWRYTGLDEGFLWRHITWERGCPPTDYVDMNNVVVSPADCRRE